MPTAIITTDDLRDLKIELLDEIKCLIQEHSGKRSKKWLKSQDVRKLLGISPGTLQTLRVNGTIPYSKIGRSTYYDYDDICKVFEQNKIDKTF